MKVKLLPAQVYLIRQAVERDIKRCPKKSVDCTCCPSMFELVSVLTDAVKTKNSFVLMEKK